MSELSHTVEKLPNDPVIVAYLHADLDPQAEYAALAADIRKLLDRQTEPVFYITDFTEATFDIGDILMASSRAAASGGGNFHHPNVKEVIFVSPAELVHFTAQGFRADAFGNVIINAFNTLDEALDYVRQV
ncbi:MAG: hypothetical protein GYB65_02315 [Chloroflexi bacterium]|nr:hypothetical protein [Chloroflexota bacterium]